MRSTPSSGRSSTACRPRWRPTTPSSSPTGRRWWLRQRTLGIREDEIRRLKADIDDLDARITTLKDAQEELRDQGDFRGYNANVAVINGLITRYNAQIDALNAWIEEYNGLLG